MNRQQFGAGQQANPEPGEQNHAIGLRAVAAAIRYQGHAYNVAHPLSRELSPAPPSKTRSDDHEP